MTSFVGILSLSTTARSCIAQRRATLGDRCSFQTDLCHSFIIFIALGESTTYLCSCSSVTVGLSSGKGRQHNGPYQWRRKEDHTMDVLVLQYGRHLRPSRQSEA
jgi:hypothetical protein